MAAVAYDHDTAVRSRPTLRVAPAGPLRAPSGPAPSGPAPSGHMAASPTRARVSEAVYRRRRVVAALVALAAGAAIVALVAAVTEEGPSHPSPSAEPVVVVVSPGDTLWDLALPHLPAGAHPTSYVAGIAADNEVDPRYLEPGTVLRLPAG